MHISIFFEKDEVKLIRRWVKPYPSLKKWFDNCQAYKWTVIRSNREHGLREPIPDIIINRILIDPKVWLKHRLGVLWYRIRYAIGVRWCMHCGRPGFHKRQLFSDYLCKKCAIVL